MVTCSTCGAENKVAATVCYVCSAVLESSDTNKGGRLGAVDSLCATVVVSKEATAPVVCPVCGTSNEKEYCFCEQCGTKIQPSDSTPSAVVDKAERDDPQSQLSSDSLKTTPSGPSALKCPKCDQLVALGVASCPCCGAAVAVEQTRVMSSVKPPPKPRLLVVLEDEQVGAEYSLEAPTVIGRRSGNITFPDDDFMSGRHAVIEKRGKSFILRDEGSRNGVFVRIKKEVELEPGDMILIGKQLFQFET